MNFKFGIFSILVLGVVILLIPTTSVANAQEYEDRYYEDKEYKKEDKKSDNEQYYNDDNKKYKKDDNKKSDEPIVIIKNEPIVKKEKKKMTEPPMLLVKKDVLYCDGFSGSDQSCTPGETIVGPNSGRYVQECSNEFQEICDVINEELFDMIVTDDIEFPGSEDGKKLTFNGERYTVTEEVNIGTIEQNSNVNILCQKAGFDGGFALVENDFPIEFCILNEGECSGIVQDGEQKECTIKNYLVELGL